MENQEPRILRYLLGDREILPLERRVLNALILASSFLATLLVIEAIVFNYRNALILTLLSAFLLWGNYLFSKKADKSDLPLWSYLSVSVLIIFADRFFVGGYAGLGLLILIAISGAVPLITRKDQLKAGALLLIIFYFALCFLTVFCWDSVPVYTPQRIDLLIQIIEAGVLVACLFLVAYLAIESYRNEKNRVSSLNRKLEMKNMLLEKSNRELELTYKEIKTLRGLLPTCSYCKKIRPENIGPNESRSWVPIERYIEQRTDASFSHGVCPECTKTHFGEEMHDKVFNKTT